MIHLSATGTDRYCGRGLIALTFRGIVRHFGIAFWLMKWFGCRACLAALDDALATARPIR